MAVNKKQEAKDYVENKIAIKFGSDYIDSVNGKIYVWGKAKDGTKMQVAITLTNPANPIDVPDKDMSGFNWADSPTIAAPEPETKMSDNEMANIATLLASLGL